MLKEHVGSIDFKVKGSGLIIVLMEHAQREYFFVRPSVLICYIEVFILINAFASEKCTCFLLKILQR